jgi:hypothetical protein
MSKTQKIEHHLKTVGSITPLEAQSNYNVWRLAAEIHRLRMAGLDVVMRMKKAPSGARYAEYSIAGQ